MTRKNCYYHFRELPSKVFGFFACFLCFFREHDWWACETMTQHIKFSAAKPADLSSIPGIRMVERERGVWQFCPLTSTCTPYPHGTQNKYVKVQKEKKI